MTKTEWDALSERQKNELVAEKVLGWHKLDVHKTEVVVWADKEGHRKTLWRFSTSRVAFLEEEIERQGRIPEYTACILEYLLFYGSLDGSDILVEWQGPKALLVGVCTKHEAARLVMAIRHAGPDLCCYCAVKDR